MGLLKPTGSHKPKRKTGSPAQASSVPSSLPDLDTSKLIDSLKAQLSEAKTSGEATAKELADLKAQLKEAQDSSRLSASSESTTSTESKGKHDHTERSSFFGF